MNSSTSKRSKTPRKSKLAIRWDGELVQEKEAVDGFHNDNNRIEPIMSDRLPSVGLFALYVRKIIDSL